MGATVPPAMLNIYLSANLSEATAKATKLTALHDEMFSTVAGDQGAFQQRSFDDAETLMRQTFEAERDPSKRAPEGASWKDWQKALTGLSGARSGLSDNDVNGGVKFGHCGGAKVGQFGASALERAALI